MGKLTLAEAIRTGRLETFAAQAEAQGIGPADRAQFDALVGAVTAPLPEGQTQGRKAQGKAR